MRKTALVVYNSSPKNALLPDMWLGEVINTLCTKGGYKVDVLATTPTMHYREITAEDLEQVDLVVAAGGDGTIRLALGACAHLKSKIPVGILPLGTGNQLARNLSIYQENILGDPLGEALKVVLEGEPQEIDLGIMNGEYFAVAAGAGPFSDAIIAPEAQEKAVWKMLAYASSMVQTFALPPVIFKVTADDETFRVAASGLFVTNIADLGVGTLSESAELDDGLLDLCILNPSEFGDYIGLGFRFAGGFVGGKAPYYIRKVKTLTVDVHAARSRLSQFQKIGRRIRHLFAAGDARGLNLKDCVTAMIDGDAYGTTPMHITVEPRAVRVMAPRRQTS
jgi:diacylglycerol kinase family enzyme